MLGSWYQRNREKVLAASQTPEKRAIRKRWLQTPRGRMNQRASQLKRLYNLTLRDYQDLWDKQRGLCYICREREYEALQLEDGSGRLLCEDGDVVPSERWLHVDHDRSCCPGNRSCGKCIRGLLCGRCNKGLGLFRDNPKLLRKAAKYVDIVQR